MAAHVCFIDIPQENQQRHRLHCNRSCSDHKERSLSPMSSAHSSPRYERNIGFFRQLSRRFGLKSSSDDLVYAAGEDDSHSSSTDSCSSTTGTLPPMQTSLTASTTSSTSTTHSGIVRDGLLLHQGSSLEHLSCASSDTSSTVDIHDELQMLHVHNNNSNTAANAAERKLSTASKTSSTRSSFSRLHRRSTSSIRRAFEGISISTARSLSCSGGTPPQQQLAKESGSGSSCSGSPAKSALKTASALELRKRSNASITAPSVKSKVSLPPQRILRQPVSYTYLKGMSGLPTQRVPRNSVYCAYARRPTRSLKTVLNLISSKRIELAENSV